MDLQLEKNALKCYFFIIMLQHSVAALVDPSLRSVSLSLWEKLVFLAQQSFFR